MTGQSSPSSSWTLPYRALRGTDGGGQAWDGGLLPGVALNLIRPEGGVCSIGTYGLIDSGADRSVLPVAWAHHLGIDLEADCQESNSRTAGGMTTCYEVEGGVDAMILGERVTLQASFNRGLPWVLLGRDDFFSHFKVSFEHRAQQFTLQLY